MHQMVTFNGNLIVIGGYSGTGELLNDVQVAPIAADGTVGLFSPTVSFTGPGRQGLGCIVVGDTLYVIGGDSGEVTDAGSSTYDDDVWYAKLDANGHTTGWTAGLALPLSSAYFALAAH